MAEALTVAWDRRLRSVTLQGVDSVMAAMARREEAWRRLAADLPVEIPAKTATADAMSNALELAPQILAGETRGRVVIDVVNA